MEGQESKRAQAVPWPRFGNIGRLHGLIGLISAQWTTLSSSPPQMSPSCRNEDKTKGLMTAVLPQMKKRAASTGQNFRTFSSCSRSVQFEFYAPLVGLDLPPLDRSFQNVATKSMSPRQDRISKYTTSEGLVLQCSMP